MPFDFDNMLGKIKSKQWALADIDWDAPGAAVEGVRSLQPGN